MNDDFDRLMRQVEAGSRPTTELLDLLYAELHAIADRLMRQERRDHTLQPTALVHEAFLRLVDSRKLGENGRLAFLDAAAVTMRRVLVDHARSARAQKRGGGQHRERVTLSGLLDDSEEDGVYDELDVARLDTALAELSELDRRQAKIVELRFFGGMTGQQIAKHLAVSRSTVIRELAFSRAWLQRRMKQAP